MIRDFNIGRDITASRDRNQCLMASSRDTGGATAKTGAHNSYSIDDVYKLVSKLGDFVVAKYVSDGREHLVITHKNLNNHLPFGLTSRCRILVSDNEYVVHVLMREVESGYLDCSEDIVNLCNKYSTRSATHKFCPGLEPSEYDKYKDVIRFDLKSVRCTSEPFIRIDSTSCLMWSELGKRAPRDRREATEVLCRPCIHLRCDLECQVNRTMAESPSRKLQRQSASSHARLKYVTRKSETA